MSRLPAVIFDRDGTLASVDWVRPVERDPESWARFNAALPFDAVVPVVAGLLRSVRPGVHRIMTSGRDGSLRPRMQDWIAKHGLPIDHLFMRRAGDRRVDSVVKTEIYRELIEPRFEVLYVVDDRPQVCDAWRELGLPVLQVADPGIAPGILAADALG